MVTMDIARYASLSKETAEIHGRTTHRPTIERRI